MRFRFLAIILLCLLFLLGCSSSGNNSIIPENTKFDTEINNPMLVGVSDYYANGAPSGGVGALGVFNLHLDPGSSSAELTSLRNSSLTDVLEVVDITNFLQMAPCTDCAIIDSVSLDSSGNLVVSIGIKHPFGVGDPLKPISGQNRADLHVFNIEGTVVSNTTATSFPGIAKTVADFSLINADGYSTYLDDVLETIYPTSATIHPYITHFDDYSAGNFDPNNAMGFADVIDPGPSGNLVMAMGCDYDYQNYVFNISNSIDFIYAIGCTYGVSSASKSERFTPEYRCPQHNKKAASEVSVEIISNDLEVGDITSTAQVEIHVVDISHGIAVGIALDEMLADSSVAGISLEVPGVETGTVAVDIMSPTGSGHDPTDPLIFPATITNSAGGTEGTYLGLVQVIDSYSPGLNTSLLLNGMDGIKRVDPLENPLNGLFNISEFATYAAFTIDVTISNLPPVAGTISLDWECYGDPCAGKLFTLTISEAYDPDSLPVTVSWDFDGNMSFDDDLDGDNSNLSGDYIYDTPGNYNAWCRVSDTVLYTDVGPFPIIVLDCTPNNPSLLTTVDSVLIHNGRKNTINKPDDYVYVIQDTGNDGSVSIIDISDPQNAFEVNAVDLNAWSATIAYYNGYVYAAGQAMQGILTIDVDPPESASIVNTWTDWSMTGSMEDMLVQGEYLYVAAQWGGFMIFSLSDPSNPTLVGYASTQGPRYTISVAVTDDAQWGFYHQGYSDSTTDLTTVVDISNPGSPSIVHSIEMPTFAMDMQIKGDYLYCVSHPWWGRTLAVVNISDPASAYIETTFQATNGCWNLELSGNYLYLPGGNLTVVDISDPLNPVNLATQSISGDARGAVEYCGIVYVSASDPTLSVVDMY